MLVFDLPQVKALSSYSASTVFWSIEARQPLAVREIAELVGKSAPSVHYHVDQLRRVGLLLKVAERKRHARQEALYVRAGVRCMGREDETDAAYRRYRLKGFASAMRGLVRQTELTLELVPHKPEVNNFSHYNRSIRHVTERQAQELTRRLEELYAALPTEPDGPDATRVQLFLVMRPTIGESRRWMRELGLSVAHEEDEPSDSV